MPSNHLILCCPLLLSPSIFPSIRVFLNESALHMRWPKYWSFSFNISPSNEHSGLISFRMDWLDLLAIQGTPKSLLQHHSSKASIIQSSAFFMVQLSHPYTTTGKTIALTRWTFVGKVMSVLFNMQSRLVIAFLPRSKCLLISWLQSPSAVILNHQCLRIILYTSFSFKNQHFLFICMHLYFGIYLYMDSNFYMLDLHLLWIMAFLIYSFFSFASLSILYKQKISGIYLYISYFNFLYMSLKAMLA